MIELLPTIFHRFLPLKSSEQKRKSLFLLLNLKGRQ